MKVPINWLNSLINLPKSQKDLTDKLTSVGHMLDKVEQKNAETILDLELRGNRADCYSILGIAREISAIYGTKIKKMGSIGGFKKVKKLKNSSLDVQTKLVKRAAMIEIYNVKISKSPKWLSSKLDAYGIESVNNIVDLTNFVMIETGEPMHAFDLDKVKGGLQIRLAKSGEKITTFHDATLTLTKDDLVWATGDKILSVAGAIGEKQHSISDLTKNVLLEAANYDRANIRRTVYRHNLLTEAGIRHEKDLDPNMVEDAFGRFLYFVKKYNWGKFRLDLFDYYPIESKAWKLDLNLDYLQKLSGVEISKIEATKILKALNFEILKSDNRSISVTVPTYRTDVTLEEDLIEEILRIYGYDKIPTKTLALSIPTNVTPDYIKQEIEVKEAASASGFSEAITLSFVRQKQSNLNISPVPGKEVVSLLNPPSPDNQDMRITLLANLYMNSQKAVHNLAEKNMLFEVGKIYYKEKGKYSESRRLGVMYWERNKSNFEEFKKSILEIFARLSIESPGFSNEIFNLPLDHSYRLNIDKKEIGFGGKIKNTFYAEIDLDSILGKEKKYKAKLWPKYPPQIEDITLVLPEKTRVGEVLQSIKSVDKLVSKVELIDVYKDSYTFNVWYQDKNKTLTDKEVEKVRERILKEVKTKFGASLKD